MFFRILKKDLKRKKTMNIILLLFVILSAMFASASVNNINAVTGGIDRYFELADVPDITLGYNPGSKAEEDLAALEGIKEIKTFEALTIWSSKNFYFRGRQLETFINPAWVYNADTFGIIPFDGHDEAIKSVEKGCFYATKQFSKGTEIKPGDTLTLKIGATEMDLKYLGLMKCATHPTDGNAPPAVLLNAADYAVLQEEPEVPVSSVQSMIKTDNIKAVQDIADNYPAEVGYTAKNDYKLYYLYDMIAAYTLMAISVLLMLTAFVVLRFSIGFTISEEFREIGVMKAVGISNGSIRSLYIAKYLAISVIGSLIGFLCSIPLSSTMMETVSENMVLRGAHSTALGLVSSAAVVIIIMLFCYSCTRRIRKLSPIDAVRSGQTGERFRKKSLLHLGRSKLPATGFLAANDVLSAPKRFGIITVVFSVCLLLITCMSNFVMTLKSEKIHMLFDIPTSEAHILDADILRPMLMDAAKYSDSIEEIETMLKENGIPGTCTTTIMKYAEVRHGDTKAGIQLNLQKGKSDYQFPVEEGSLPQKPDEVTATSSVFEMLHVKIGDRITARIEGKEYEFIITGRHSSFMSPSLRLHTDFDFGHTEVSGSTGINIRFEGNPDKETIAKDKEIIKKALGTDKVYTTSEIIQEVTGMTDTMKSIRDMMLIISGIVTVMIVVLMERSFISKEKSEIALMKAVGISNGSIIAQHTLRFGITSVFACILSTAVLFPVSNLLFGLISSMIGDVSKITCDFDPVSVFVIYPLLLIGAAVTGAFLTALYTRTIQASDTASIE